LVGKWGESNNRFETQYGVQVYHISPGQGLEVDEGACIGIKKWSILAWARIGNVNGVKKIIGSSDWDSSGLYVKDTKYTVLPANLGLFCPEELLSERFYRFGVTRDEEGNLAIYLNGFQCAKAKIDSAESNGFKLSPHDIAFFRGDGDVNPEVFLRQVTIWDKALEPKDMIKASDCKAATVSTSTCKGVVTLNVPYSGHSFSNSWGNYQVGVVWGESVFLV
jgi:hypothetical protein